MGIRVSPPVGSHGAEQQVHIGKHLAGAQQLAQNSIMTSTEPKLSPS
jgi:hypothetical protein